MAKKITVLPKGKYILASREMMLYPAEGLHYQFDIEQVRPGEAVHSSILALGDEIPCIFLHLVGAPHEEIGGF